MYTYEASDYVRVSVIYVHVFIVEGTLQRGHRRGIPTSETRRKCQWVDREWYEEFKSDNYEEPVERCLNFYDSYPLPQRPKKSARRNIVPSTHDTMDGISTKRSRVSGKLKKKNNPCPPRPPDITHSTLRLGAHGSHRPGIKKRERRKRRNTSRRERKIRRRVTVWHGRQMDRELKNKGGTILSPCLNELRVTLTDSSATSACRLS